MNLNHLLSRTAAKLAPDPKSKAQIERILSTPEVTRILERDENEQLAARRAKIDRKAALPGKHEKAIAAAVRRGADIAKRKAAAEKALYDLREEERDAACALHGVSFVCADEVAAIDQELIADADPRISAALFVLGDLTSNHLRHATRFAIAADGRSGGQVVSNTLECNAAMCTVTEAINACRAMQLEALSARDVETKLGTIFDRLVEPLAAINLQGPYLADGNVLTGARPRAMDHGDAA